MPSCDSRRLWGGSCLEVVGGAASCSRGGANLNRQDRMHIKRANVFRGQIFKNLNNFSHTNNCIFTVSCSVLCDWVFFCIYISCLSILYSRL